MQDSPFVPFRKLSVIGLGYVGLPVAVAFGLAGYEVVAFDTRRARIDELRRGHDRTREVETEALSGAGLRFSDDPADLARADFHIITVPTPITDAQMPDLRHLIDASHMVGRHLKKGDIVVVESTVYPGVTEEECVPVLEAESGLTFGTDFTVGYSPERINPGDKEHRFTTIRKVVSGSDPATCRIVAEVYGSVVQAGVYRAPSIKVAEASKIIENVQRDLNISLMNELSLIFNRLGIDTKDVLAAAGTKWNFLPFSPGLVGGHCISVDPYYLTYCAARVGYHCEVILAGRRINNRMGRHVAQEVIRHLVRTRPGRTPLVSVLGGTFKENIPDIRNNRVIDIVRELEAFGVEVQFHDPLADAGEMQAEYGLTLMPLDSLKPADVLVLAVPHQVFLDGGWPLITGLLIDGQGMVADVKAALDRQQAPDGVQLWRL